MALNPPSANQPKGQPPRSSGTGEKPSRVSAPPAVGAASGPVSSNLGPNDPKRVGKYDIQKKLGAGGMGTVYLALDPQLKRQVALKLLPKEKAENPNLVRRFHSEAQAAANLRHENIVTVYEAGEADGYLFMALEFVDGVDTAELISRRGVVPVKRSIEIIRQILKALDHAFSKKIVHRDIKPANLLIRRDGLVKLTDLGLARSREDPIESGITRAGTTVGTIDYMPPEQARDSKAADVRSDIYSLGCTWYYLLTGEAPYPEGNLTNKLRAHSETPFPDPRLKNKSVPEGVVAVMRRMTEKDPRARYQTPAEVLADLDQSSHSRAMAPEVALGDLARDEELASASPTYRGGRSSTAVPPVHVPPSPNEKLKKPAGSGDDDEAAPRDYRWMIYGGIALGALAVIGGVGWIVKSFSSNFDAPRHVAIEDPFKNRRDTPAPTERTPSKSAETPPANTGTDQSQRPGENPLKADPKANQKVVTTTKLGAESAPATQNLNELPKWVSESTPVPATFVRVSINPRTMNEAATVHEAIQKLPAEGGVVELNGAGPFVLRPIEVIDKSRVLLQAGEGSSTPIVLLLPHETARDQRPILSLRGTHLELRGLHFATSRKLFDAPPECLIQIRNGDFISDRCTFTVAGAASTPAITAVKIGGDQGRGAPPGEPAHVRVDQTLFRGPSLTALATELPHADVVVRNSYIWAGSAPALKLEAPGKNPVADTRLEVHLLQDTLVSESCGLEIPRNAGDVPLQNPLRVGLLETVIATPALPSGTSAKGKATLCSLPGWTKANARGALGRNFQWQSDRSLYLGWDRLLEVPADGTVLASAYPEWHSVFSIQKQSSGEGTHFRNIRWPAQSPADASILVPASLSFDSLGNPFVKSENGGWPGATPGSLVPTDASASLLAAEDLPARAAFPDALLGPGDSTTLRVDLMREDLGKAIAGMRLRTGMTIIASGNNRHLCTPFTIEGAWIHLKFEQTDGPPLILTPRGPAATRGSGPLSDDALISVRNGGLSLSNAFFDAPVDDRKPIPRWYVQGVNSDLVLRNCRIEAPITSGTTNLGVIQWLRNGAGAPVRQAGLPQDADGYLVLQECYFSGAGAIVQADMGRRQINARNCVGVARNALFDIRSNPGVADRSGSINFDRCTWSAAENYVRIDGSASPLETAVPMEIFADRCVFAPPLKIGDRSNPAVVLALPAAALSGKQIRWSEAYCGYSPEISKFLKTFGKPGEEAPSLSAEAWEKKWGPLRIVAPLFSPDGVKLAEPLPDRRKLEPGSFRLNRNCEAVSWAPYGKLIGADVRTMVLPETRNTKSAGTGSSPPVKTKGPGGKAPTGNTPKGAPPKVERGF